MKLHRIAASLAAALSALPCAYSTASAADALDSLSVPDGFIVDRVAGPPLVDRPIMASFDDSGRLYVADSAGVNLRGEELAKAPPHRIVVLEDADNDGTFDNSRVFADKIVFPQGLLWHDGAVFVASPPCLWRLDDTDGDGVCDERTPLITGFPLTGVSDDVHGACLGPDGFVYVCSGRFPHHLHDVDGKPLEPGGTQPVLVRCRPDGSRAEIVGGLQGNGVEVAWTAEGDAFVSGTFYGGEGMRDALIHFVEGGDYPVLGMPITSHQMKSTGDLLPPLVHMPATAPAGIMRYRGRVMGEKFQDNLFCTYFNLHAVHRHVIERDGATFRAGAEPFLSSTSADLHPTDVLEDDADGSLLVVDTGGWFRIGCPTSQIAKPDIKGGIYRVRNRGQRRSKAPFARAAWWSGAAAEKAAPYLQCPIPAVQERSVQRLAKIGADAVPTLIQTLSKPDDKRPDNLFDKVRARRNAVWALTRIDGPVAREAVRAALADANPGVRQAAAYSVGLHRDTAAGEELTRLLSDGAPPVRREAANALGRIGKPEAVAALLAALKGGAADRFLEHAVIYALIQIGDREATAKGLREGDASVRRGALIALDRMEGGRLTPELVTPLLDPAEPALRTTAARVVARHPEWAAPMLGYFRETLAARGDALTGPQREELRQQLTAFAADPAVQDLVAGTLRSDKTGVAVKLLMLETIGEGAAGGLPEFWAAALTQCLEDRDDRVARQAVLSVRGLPDAKRPVLTRVDPNVDLESVGGDEKFAGTDLVHDFAVRWTGLVRVPRDGRYTFATISDDGSRLFVDGRKVVDNGGHHGMVEKSGEVDLKAGDHALRLELFQGGGGKGCRLLWSAAGQSVAIPPEALFHHPKSDPDGPPARGLIGEYFVVREPFEGFPDLNTVDFDGALLAMARDATRPADVRVDAVWAAAPRLDSVDAPLLDLLLASLDKSNPVLLRAAAADALARLKLKPAQLKGLAGALQSAGPVELPKLLTAFERGGDAEVGAALVAALDRAPAARGLRPEAVQETLAPYPAQVRQSALPLLKRLSAAAADQKARLDELERTAVGVGGDASRGRAVFFGAKAACATCHAARGEGGRVGPDLSKIGAVRAPRDLLEALVFPSASFARTYEPYVVRTKGGAVESGVITRETADAIHLTTGPRTEKRIARADIADLRPGGVSVMPQGLETQLSPGEMADLIAFLSSLK